MIRWMVAAVLMCVAVGCSSGTTNTVPNVTPPDAFVGAWRSVTPSLEFMRLSVHSKSSEMGVLGARLTFSGVAWEGGGRIDGDSLVVDVTIAGTSASGVIVAHASDARTLRVRMQHASAAPLDLTLVRED
jgi:hypothetical protein